LGFLRKCFAGRKKLFWLSAGLVLLADQLSKSLLWHLPEAGREPVVLIPHVLQVIGHGGNPGGALGLPGSPLLYGVAALVGLALIAFFFATTGPGEGLVHCGLGLLAGGAMGNLIDRVNLGFVRDFIDLHWKDAFHWYTFNVADAAICLGFGIILFGYLFSGERSPHPEEEEASERYG
jgi:signal peptidase II